MKRKVVTLCLAVALLSSTITGCTIGDTEFVLNMNSVGRNHVFSINGEKCTKEEARLYLCNYQNIYGYAYSINLWEYDDKKLAEDGSLEEYVKDITLAELANSMCMEQLAEQQELTLTQEEKDKVAKAAEEYYESLSKEERSYIGVDKNKMKRFYEKYAISQKLYNTLTQGINEEVSDDEARVMHIQQIFVKSEEKAQLVQKKLANKEKFESLATTYNEADIIERNLARGEYPEAVDDVVFHLDDGEISTMITTDKGYYFIKCLDKFDKELTEENKEIIIAKRRKEQFEDKLIEFIENSQFDLNEKVWDEIKVDTSGKIKTNSFFEIYEKYFTE
ncbi:MAG: peptidyl-prolyl cis-trans isomerase [Agathobacter sp.]|nr:peptidyl-prolyl cis-trans isomerase [Agathobacter sp.]